MRVLRLILVLMFMVVGAYAQVVFDGCPMTGDAKQPEAIELNPLKNRYTDPQQSDFDGTVTLAAILQPGNDEGRWSTAKAAELTGFVYNVKVGGNETCNCHASDPPHRDTHVELTLDDSPESTAPSRRVIVEVTPRIRRAMQATGVDWSTAGLQQAILHKWIKVQGWMFFDAEHANASENTNPNGTSNWRATAWEIHPITSLQVVDAQSASAAAITQTPTEEQPHRRSRVFVPNN
jgi:hypothetical protein